jgi:hypothetical protein
MNRAVGVLIRVTVIVLLLSLTVYADEPHYVGAGKCKICHNKKSEVQQFDIWKDSKHSHAYETLASDQAKVFATEAGIETDPQQTAECLECHVTGLGLDSTMFAESFSIEDGVQCESCHGPGSEYKAVSIMSASKYKKQRDKQHELAVEAGLVIPDEETCKACHNERSPAFKGFDFAEYYAKIKHEYAAE